MCKENDFGECMYRLQGRCPYRPGARIHFFSRTFFVPYIFFSVHFLFRTFLNTAYTHIAWCPHCFFCCTIFFKTADGPGARAHDAMCFLHTNARRVVFSTHKHTMHCVFYTHKHKQNTKGKREHRHTHIHTYMHVTQAPS